MQHSPSEIKDKLLKALDKEYNVVDMATVFEIVSILERTPITKEALEATRLGKYINELRRKTTNESLAKRAKDLVRRWRNLISRPPECQPSNHQTNGSRTISPGVRSNPELSPGPAPFRPVISPSVSAVSERSASPANQGAGTHRGPDPVPRTHAANKRLRKDSGGGGEPPCKVPRLNGVVGGGGNKPHLLERPRPLESKPRPLENKPHPLESKPHPLEGRPRPLDSRQHPLERPRPLESKPRPLESKPHPLDASGECSRDSLGSGSVVEIPQPPPEPRVPKKRGRKKGSTKEALNAARNAAKQQDDIVMARIASIARNPKVKTTRELLAGLQAKCSDKTEVKPPPSLPLPRGSALDALEMSRNKTEHIARFLRSQSELGPELGPQSPGPDLPEDTRPELEVGSDQLRSVSRLDQSEDVFTTPSASAANIARFTPDRQTVEEILARLPPLPEHIDWSDSEPDSAPKAEPIVTDSQVDRLHSEPWPNVNGVPNDGQSDGFREWHECVSKTSYRGELLHILPYVVID